MRYLPLLLCLLACDDDDDAAADAAPPPPPDGGIAFPADFLFGTATAGFQVEPGCPTLDPEACEDRHSDWYHFVTDPRTVESSTAHLSGQPVSTGPGFWELYEGDLDRARDELHNNAFRMSIEWSRVFPVATDDADTDEALAALADPAALEGYHAILAAALARDMKVMVTVSHYSLPDWLHDGVGCHLDAAACERRGWVDRERAVREIAKYAGFLGREFGAEVDLWATLNEPFALLLPGYLLPNEERTNPPARTLATDDAKEVLRALVEAHARIYDALHANDDEARVGVVYNLTPARPKDPDNPVDVQAAENFFYLWNTVFMDGVARGDFDHDLDGTAEHRDDLAGRMDFIGINYYTRVTVEGTERSFFPAISELLTLNPLTLVLWEDYPKGLYEMVKWAHERYGLPVMITENGTLEDARSSFLVRHLTWLGRAVEEGFPVEGYFFWSLMDNIEWNHGFGLRFGLYEVDPEDPQKRRVARDVARVYGEIAERHHISDQRLAEFPVE